VKTRS